LALSGHQAWLNFPGAIAGWATLWLEAVTITWYASSGAKLEFGISDMGGQVSSGANRYFL
jgi:hypothetical protein